MSKDQFDRFNGRPPVVTIEQYQRIVEVREARASIPSDKELAIELGLNHLTVGTLIRRGVKTYELILARKSRVLRR